MSEWANGRTGDWANGRVGESDPGPVGRKTRRAEDVANR
jgi:hypothetical protein